jgi:hypothetical protein
METFYQDSKGHLGLDAYRMRSAEAIGKHWCLVFVAYSLLHLDCLPSSPRKGSLPEWHSVKPKGPCQLELAVLSLQRVVFPYDLLYEE